MAAKAGWLVADIVARSTLRPSTWAWNGVGAVRRSRLDTGAVVARFGPSASPETSVHVTRESPHVILGLGPNGEVSHEVRSTVVVQKREAGDTHEDFRCTVL